MPANIAHMLICHKSLKKLKEKNIPQLSKYIDILSSTEENANYKAYMNLGSLGPDMFYYSSLISGVKDMLKDGYIQAKGVEPWSYHLHSINPRQFPLKLIEIVFRDAKKENGQYILEKQDYCRIAFIAGYLTHIAADQIIHPIVNKIAGPYYREGGNRKEHRECEVFQDFFLYENVYRLEEKTGEKYDFFQQDFNLWCDCIRGVTFKNTEDWFRYFIQRGFAETYMIFPDEDIIEDCVDNILFVLKNCVDRGPYKKAYKEYKELGNESPRYKKYIEEIDYLKYYRIALELSVVYLLVLYEAFELLNNNSDPKKHQERFLSILSDADLSCPLDSDILSKAEIALKSSSNITEEIQVAFNAVQQANILNAQSIIEKSDLKDVMMA